MDIFAFHGVEIDLSSEDQQDQFKPYTLHYKYIVGKIQRLIKSGGRDHVLSKFPDKAKPFYLPSNNDVFVKSAPMETDEYE